MKKKFNRKRVCKMINDKRVSEIINEILKKEMNITIEKITQFEELNKEITDTNLEMDYKNMILLYPTILLEYVDNIEKNITYNEEQGNIIKEAQKQLEKWISIYESPNIVSESYEYLIQEKNKLDNNFKEKTRNKGLEESLLFASAKIGGIALRNLQRENNNLNGDIEEYPYTKEELEMIDKFSEITEKQEILEEYVELNYSEEDEEEM